MVVTGLILRYGPHFLRQTKGMTPILEKRCFTTYRVFILVYLINNVKQD